MASTKGYMSSSRMLGIGMGVSFVLLLVFLVYMMYKHKKDKSKK